MSNRSSKIMKYNNEFGTVSVRKIGAPQWRFTFHFSCNSTKNADMNIGDICIWGIITTNLKTDLFSFEL